LIKVLDILGLLAQMLDIMAFWEPTFGSIPRPMQK